MSAAPSAAPSSAPEIPAFATPDPTPRVTPGLQHGRAPWPFVCDPARFARARRLCASNAIPGSSRIAAEHLPGLRLERVLYHTDAMVEQDQLDHRSHTYALLRVVEPAGPWPHITTARAREPRHVLAVRHGGGIEYLALDVIQVPRTVLVTLLTTLDDHDAFWLADTLMKATRDHEQAGQRDALQAVVTAKAAGTLAFPRKGGRIHLELNATPKPAKAGKAGKGAATAAG